MDGCFEVAPGFCSSSWGNYYDPYKGVFSRRSCSISNSDIFAEFHSFADVDICEFFP